MGWVESLDEVEEAGRVVRALVSAELLDVRYVTMDDGRMERAPDHRGPRVIEDVAEWSSPRWTFGVGDSVDYGVELDLSSGRTLAVSWETPGEHESLDVFPGRLIGSQMDEAPDVAIWSVADASRWQQLVGQSITAAELHFIPWAPDEGFWCTRVTLSFGRDIVVLMLGEIDEAGHVARSADNVAVLFTPSDLPTWELR